MNGQDLMQQIEHYTGLLNKAVPEFKDRGIKTAETEKAYRVALRTEFLRLKADGEKVTIMSDMARGKEDIAELKMQRDIAETLYKSAQEGINVYKKQLDTVMAIYKNEWTQAKR